MKEVKDNWSTGGKRGFEKKEEESRVVTIKKKRKLNISKWGETKMEEVIWKRREDYEER